MQATERLWRTADGKLVRDGDQAATELAYTPGDEIDPKDESLMPGDESHDSKADDKSDAKQVQQPANKAATRPADK